MLAYLVQKRAEIVRVRVLCAVRLVALYYPQIAPGDEACPYVLKVGARVAAIDRHASHAWVRQRCVPLVREYVGCEPHLLRSERKSFAQSEQGAGHGSDPVARYHPPVSRHETGISLGP